jgi:hypothetical protein
MPLSVRRAKYFYTKIEDRPGEGVKWLARLQAEGINLLAFTTFPLGDGRSQFDFFPENPDRMRRVFAATGDELVGPRKAFLIQGENSLGALVNHHTRLAQAGINVYAANGASDGKSRFGYVLWVEPRDYEKAAEILGC